MKIEGECGSGITIHGEAHIFFLQYSMWVLWDICHILWDSCSLFI